MWTTSQGECYSATHHPSFSICLRFIFLHIAWLEVGVYLSIYISIKFVRVRWRVLSLLVFSSLSVYLPTNLSRMHYSFLFLLLTLTAVPVSDIADGATSPGRKGPIPLAGVLGEFPPSPKGMTNYTPTGLTTTIVEVVFSQAAQKSVPLLTYGPRLSKGLVCLLLPSSIPTQIHLTASQNEIKSLIQTNLTTGTAPAALTPDSPLERIVHLPVPECDELVSLLHTVVEVLLDVLMELLGLASDALDMSGDDTLEGVGKILVSEPCLAFLGLGEDGMVLGVGLC